jgi:hypothetical protein
MIKIKITIKNDHRRMTEDFEVDQILLSFESPQIQEWVKKMMEEFKDPVDDVILKATMTL